MLYTNHSPTISPSTQPAPQWQTAIVTVAKNAGTYVTSHSYTPQAIQQAINLGVRGIEHGNLIDLETAKLMAEKERSLLLTYLEIQASRVVEDLWEVQECVAKASLC